MKKVLSVFIFIIKCTFVGFGGGNAIFPVIKKEAVEHRKWITKKEFDNLVIATNSIPGPSVVESLSYIAMKMLGKTKGAIVALLAFLPHVFLALLIFILISNYLPKKYLIVIAISVMPVIAGILLSFGIRYLKESNQGIKSKSLWIFIFLLTLCFTLFIPSPYNAPVVIIIGIIVSLYLYTKIKSKKAETP